MTEEEKKGQLTSAEEFELKRKAKALTIGLEEFLKTGATQNLLSTIQSELPQTWKAYIAPGESETLHTFQMIDPMEQHIVGEATAKCIQKGFSVPWKDIVNRKDSFVLKLQAPTCNSIVAVACEMNEGKLMANYLMFNSKPENPYRPPSAPPPPAIA